MTGLPGRVRVEIRTGWTGDLYVDIGPDDRVLAASLDHAGDDERLCLIIEGPTAAMAPELEQSP